MAPLVVIGAGLAGWTTVREFRKLDSTTPVVLVTADSGDFYAKPSLSNAFAQAKLPAQLISTPAARMAETQQVTLLAHTRVQAIDTAAKTLQVSDPSGQVSTLAFRDLVLATGAQPIRLPLAGALCLVFLYCFAGMGLALVPRLLIAPELRDFAGLERKVWMVGLGSHFELWSDAGWQAQNAAAVEVLQSAEPPAGFEDFAL